LSQLVGRNETYMQQYVRKGSPRELPESVREILSAKLGIPVDELLGQTSSRFSALPAVPLGLKLNEMGQRAIGIGTPLAGQSGSPGEGSAPSVKSLVPLFATSTTIDEKNAIEWVSRPAGYAGQGAVFAVWVDEATERFRPGDMIFVRPPQPVRAGDPVVVVARNRIVAIGDLVERTESAVTVKSSGAAVSYSLPENTVWRIAAAVFR